MRVAQWIIAGLWLLFVAYWAFAAIGAKRSAGGSAWRRGLGPRVILVVLLVALLRSRSLRQIFVGSQRYVGHSEIVGAVGVALCVLGFALAFSARHHLGRNWGPPMSRKLNPELISSGPYAFIRHPIYTGLLLAMLGSAIGLSLVWALLLVVSGPYFIYSARREEALMLQTFPNEYAAYRARTGMLLPHAWRRR